MSPTPAHVRLTRASGTHRSACLAETYDMVLVVDHDGRLDPDGCITAGRLCKVRSLRCGKTVAVGLLRRTGPAGWGIDFPEGEPSGTFQDLEATPLLPGNSVTLTDTTGVTEIYMVAAFGPVG